MYFPIFRGRQFELIALRELVEKGILSEKVIPVIEPVKASSTYVKTIEAFIAAKRKIAIIHNPQVGTMEKDLSKDVNSTIKEKVIEFSKSRYVIPVCYVDTKLQQCIYEAADQDINIEKMILICNKPDYIDVYEEVVGSATPLYNFIPDKGDFRRRIRPNKVLCEDHFPKQDRNVDYSKIESEFFSNDHLIYKEDGYIGFSDYSVIGEEYSETGFAPYAVAIHIVYFDAKGALRIAHFVSDTNDDISDPAGKFAEAAGKLVEWNKQEQLHTLGITEIENAYKNFSYPGLGVIKKLSIMHHLELVCGYLEKEK